MGKHKDELERTRIADLESHDILDSPASPEFDDLVRLAALICAVPIAAVSLIDRHRQWFKAITGLHLSETSRDTSFCSHTIQQSGIMIVNDASIDGRFKDNPIVTSDQPLLFYAGVPIFSESGNALGSICVMDTYPRGLSAEQAQALRLLAKQAEVHLASAATFAQMKRIVAEQHKTELALQSERDFQSALLESLTEGIVACDSQGTLTLFNRATREFHGLPEQPLPPERWAEKFDLYLADGKTLMQKEDIPLYRAFMEDVVKDVEFVIAPKNGVRRTLLANGQAIRGTDGLKIGAVAAMHDITESKKIEQALAESEARLRRLSDSALEGIAITQAGFVVDANQALIEELGYESREEIVGLDGALIGTPEYQHLIRLKIANNDEEPYEAILQRRNGSTFIAEIRARLSTLNGKPARITAIRNVTQERVMERELLERDVQIHILVESAPIILYKVNVEGIVTLSEGAGLKSLGMTLGDAVGTKVADFTKENPIRLKYARKALSGESVSYDANVLGLHFHVELRPMIGPDHRPDGFIGVCFDITERVASEERFHLLFDQSPYAHLIFDETIGIVECNAATLTMMRCSSKDDLLGKHPSVLSPEYQPDGQKSSEKAKKMDKLARKNGKHVFEWQQRASDGHEYPVEVTLTPISYGGRQMLLSVWHDLSERKRQEEDARLHAIAVEYQRDELEKLNSLLADLATTDGLTGLKNHRAFQEALSDEVSRATRYNMPLAIVLMDVDNFKYYNDSYGHPAGDFVLKSVASEMSKEGRETDLVARYGGEEFVLILPMTDLRGAIAIAERLRATIESYDWPLAPVTASFGVASLGVGCENGAAMFEKADAALYVSKRSGRNCVSWDGMPPTALSSAAK